MSDAQNPDGGGGESVGGGSGIEPDNTLSGAARMWLGLYLAATSALLTYLFAKFWPADLSTSVGSQTKEILFWGSLEVPTTADLRMLLLVLFGGALGSIIHAIQSYVDFHGNRQLARSWVPWYLMRPIVGALMALVFYLLVRGGLITGALQGSGSQATVSVVGFAGASALVGMFSDLAAMKLKEVFKAIFATAVSAERNEPLRGTPPAAAPEIASTEPNKLVANSQPQKLAVLGSKFVPESRITVDGKERKTTVESAGKLIADLLSEDTAKAGKRVIAVVNPPAKGGASKDYPLDVS